MNALEKYAAKKLLIEKLASLALGARVLGAGSRAVGAVGGALTGGAARVARGAKAIPKKYHHYFSRGHLRSGPDVHSTTGYGGTKHRPLGSRFGEFSRRRLALPLSFGAGAAVGTAVSNPRRTQRTFTNLKDSWQRGGGRVADWLGFQRPSGPGVTREMLRQPSLVPRPGPDITAKQRIQNTLSSASAKR
jgi:hypothetical protein